jgi:AcrR family transcriptional regulator
MPSETPEKAAGRVRRTQPERVAESDRRMLAAALRLIGERGYRGTSLAAIGEAAGYSRGLAHERFGSKAGLLWAAVKHVLRVWNQEGQARGNPAHVGVDALCDMIDNHRHAVEHGEGLRPFYALMFEAIGPTPDLLPEFRALHRRFRAQIEHTLSAGVAAGTIRRDIIPAAQAALLLGALRGVAYQWLLEPNSFSLDTTYGELKSNLRRTLAP